MKKYGLVLSITILIGSFVSTGIAFGYYFETGYYGSWTESGEELHFFPPEGWTDCQVGWFYDWDSTGSLSITSYHGGISPGGTPMIRILPDPGEANTGEVMMLLNYELDFDASAYYNRDYYGYVEGLVKTVTEYGFIGAGYHFSDTLTVTSPSLSSFNQDVEILGELRIPVEIGIPFSLDPLDSGAELFYDPKFASGSPSFLPFSFNIHTSSHFNITHLAVNVSEPSTILLLGLGIAGLSGFRRKKKKNQVRHIGG